jgi:hypothetical protein
VYGTVGQFDGWSVPNPSPADANPSWDRSGNDGWDDVNNVEQVEIQFPEVGDWLIDVVGFSIPTTTPFAVVAGADFGPQQEFKIDLSSESPLSMEATQDGDIIFPFSVTNFGTSVDNVFMSSTTIPGITISFPSLAPTNVVFNVGSTETVSTLTLCCAEFMI